MLKLYFLTTAIFLHFSGIAIAQEESEAKIYIEVTFHELGGLPYLGTSYDPNDIGISIVNGNPNWSGFCSRYNDKFECVLPCKINDERAVRYRVDPKQKFGYLIRNFNQEVIIRDCTPSPAEMNISYINPALVGIESQINRIEEKIQSYHLTTRATSRNLENLLRFLSTNDDEMKPFIIDCLNLVSLYRQSGNTTRSEIYSRHVTYIFNALLHKITKASGIGTNIRVSDNISDYYNNIDNILQKAYMPPIAKLKHSEISLASYGILYSLLLRA